MNLSIFDIPLLKDGVTQYLSTRDLAHCVLTCKDWFEWFTPTLWSTVDFNRKALMTPEELSALSRHQDFVLSIMGLQRYMALVSVGRRQFRNLQFLDHTPGWASPLEDSVLLMFVRKTPSLQSLVLTQTPIRGAMQQLLIETLQSLPKLRKLDLTCYQVASSIAVQQIIQTCLRFECLRLILGNGIPANGRNIEEEEIEQCKTVQVAMEQMEDSQIRELGIRLSLAIQERAILLPLLERCPLLERLELEWLHDPQTLPQIIDILQAGKCPRLKHVRVSSIVRFDAGEESIAGLIRALGYDSGDHEGSGERELGGLESFTVEAILPFERRCIQALTRYHGGTLTVLDVMSLRQLKFEFFIGLVRGLPRLRSLMAAVWIWFRPDASADIDEALQTQWVCLGLKELEIGLQMGDDVTIDSNHRAGNGSLADRYMTYMFTQLGRLAELEDWKLTSSADLLTLDRGYLRQLSGLTRLKGLNLRRCPNIKLGVKEAEWMLENWKHLIHVRVYDGKAAPSHDGYEWPPDAAKATLQARRPWISIS